jgi:hypothetical protein
MSPLAFQKKMNNGWLIHLGNESLQEFLHAGFKHSARIPCHVKEVDLVAARKEERTGDQVY